jgi:hypothetical protein
MTHLGVCIHQSFQLNCRFQFFRIEHHVIEHRLVCEYVIEKEAGGFRLASDEGADRREAAAV